MPPQSTPFTEARTVEIPILKRLRTARRLAPAWIGQQAGMQEGAL